MSVLTRTREADRGEQGAFRRLHERCRAAGLRVGLCDYPCPACGSDPKNKSRGRCLRCSGRVPWARSITVRTRSGDLVVNHHVQPPDGPLDQAAQHVERTLRANGRLR